MDKISLTLITVIIALLAHRYFYTGQEANLPSTQKSKVTAQAPSSDGYQTYINGFTDQALELLHEERYLTKNQNSLASIYNLLSHIYRAKLNYEQFERYNKKTRDIIDQDAFANHPFKSIIALSTTRALYETGKTKEAINELSKHINTSSPRCQDKSMTHQFLVIEYAYIIGLATNKWDKALSLYESCIKYVKKTPQIPNKFYKNIYFMGALIYGGRGMTLEAERKLKKYLKLTKESEVYDLKYSQLFQVCLKKRSSNEFDHDQLSSQQLQGHWKQYCQKQ